MDQSPFDGPTQSSAPPPYHGDAPGPSGQPPPPHLHIRPHPWAAWLLILLMIAFLMSLPYLAGTTEEANAEQQELAAQLANETVESQGKLFLALKYGLGTDSQMLAGQIGMLNDGEAGQRHRAVVLAYEFGGMDAAREALNSIDELAAGTSRETADDAAEPLEMDETSRAVQAALRALYAADPALDAADDPPPTPADPSPPNLDALSDADRALLIDQLGFLGEVAVNPPSLMTDDDRDQLFASAVAAVIIGGIFFILFGLAALGGFVGLIVMLVQALSGRLRSRVPYGGAYTGVYIETVAVWVIVFFGSQMTLAPLLAAAFPADAQMLAVFIVFMATLLVLLWPVLRGVPWSVVRSDIGWTLGARPALEPVIGVAGYFMMIPLMVVGILLTLLLLMLAQLVFGEMAMPIHPIAGETGGGGVAQLLLLLLLASVAAPIVEETVFRGLMYRHLRDRSRRMTPMGSIVLSALISALIFAVIHPEGILGTPAKASIGIALALMREWRGTLIPSMIMHGLSNAVVITLLWGMMNL